MFFLKNVTVKSVVYAGYTTLFHANRSIEMLTETMHFVELYALNLFSTNNGPICNNDKPDIFFILSTDFNWATHFCELSKIISRVSYPF